MLQKQWRLRLLFGKFVSAAMSLTTSQTYLKESILNDFPNEIGGDVNKCSFLVLSDEICPDMENLHNSVNW